MGRVAVFYDWQNCYQQARKAFALESEPSERGVFDPLELARILTFGNKRGDEGQLVRVEIHRGLPSSTRQAYANAATLRHRDAWEALSPVVKVRLRPLAYHPDTGVPYEKGVDVALALSVVEDIVGEFCDIAIVFSHDSDLLPLIETVRRHWGPHRIETVSWKNDATKYYKRIPRIGGVVHHTLRREVFGRIETPINYGRETH